MSREGIIILINHPLAATNTSSRWKRMELNDALIVETNIHKNKYNIKHGMPQCKQDVIWLAWAAPGCYLLNVDMAGYCRYCAPAYSIS